MSEEGENERIKELKAEIAVLKREIISMREELEETNRGTLALYNEIEGKNEELQRHKTELERKNRRLSKALQDLEESEEARIESARMAAIGSVVVTYNHEINNPLAIIFGCMDLVSMSTHDIPPEIKENLTRIARAADRIKDVIRKIKQYEKLLPTGYMNWDMLDINSSESKKVLPDDVA